MQLATTDISPHFIVGVVHCFQCVHFGTDSKYLTQSSRSCADDIPAACVQLWQPAKSRVGLARLVSVEIVAGLHGARLSTLLLLLTVVELGTRRHALATTRQFRHFTRPERNVLKFRFRSSTRVERVLNSTFNDMGYDVKTLLVTQSHPPTPSLGHHSMSRCHVMRHSRPVPTLIPFQYHIDN